MLAPTRWRLRKAVKAVNEALGSLDLLKHPDKTFIGRIERGFDFLGYQFRPGQLSVAQKTMEQFVARAVRLYEQEPGEANASANFCAYGISPQVSYALVQEDKPSWSGATPKTNFHQLSDTTQGRIQNDC